MIPLTAAVLGALGLVCLLTRGTLLGVLVGAQLLLTGACLALVWAGAATGAPLTGHVFGLFVAIGGAAQLSVGYALAVRLFYLRRTAEMSELRSLKR